MDELTFFRCGMFFDAVLVKNTLSISVGGDVIKRELAYCRLEVLENPTRRVSHRG